MATLLRMLESDTRELCVGPDTDSNPSFGGGANANFTAGPSGSANTDLTAGIGGSDNTNITIAEVLRDPKTNERVQKYAARYIEQNLVVLLQETGLTEKDVVRVPSLFQDPSAGDPSGGAASFMGADSNLPPRRSNPPPGEMTLSSFYPAAINGIVIGRSYIGAQAFGPIIKGVDIFQDAVAQVYKKAGMDAHFVDDFYSHHTGGGEVHCGTNTFRETAVKWW